MSLSHSTTVAGPDGLRPPSTGKRRFNTPPDLDWARSVYCYNPDTGLVVYQVVRGPVRAGTKVGWVNKYGRLNTLIGRRHFDVARLAWFLHHGFLPNQIIDHKDGDPLNNCICNLRLATGSQNCANRKERSGKKNPYKGVCKNLHGEKWTAKICKDYGEVSIGSFDTAEAAHEAYIRAAKHYYGDFARAK